MPDISKITLPSGTTYNIKDAEARDLIDSIIQSPIIVFVGVSSTELTDGGTEIATINDKVLTPQLGNLVFYGTQEFIYGADEKWHALGSFDNLGSLAYKNNASTSYTPQGTITPVAISLKTSGATTNMNSITAVGELPNFSTTVSNENLTISWNAGTLPTQGPNINVKITDPVFDIDIQPEFIGTSANIIVS